MTTLFQMSAILSEKIIKKFWRKRIKLKNESFNFLLAGNIRRFTESRLPGSVQRFLYILSWSLKLCNFWRYKHFLIYKEANENSFSIFPISEFLYYFPNKLWQFCRFSHTCANPQSPLKRNINYSYNLIDLIQLPQFLHNIELVEPTKPDETEAKGKWHIRVRDLRSGATRDEYFDGVMVCNGHYFEPSLPTLKGREKFKGPQLHSHDYRNAEPFADKRVVVFGAGPSGTLALFSSKRWFWEDYLRDLRHGVTVNFGDDERLWVNC